MLKKLSLIFCITLLILFVSCKQDKLPSNDTSSVLSDTQSTQSITSGIELEEDVFDDSDITSTPSDDNSSKDNTSLKENTSQENGADDNTSNNTSSDENPDQEDSNQNEEVVIDDDGTIKLPIDKFN